MNKIRQKTGPARSLNPRASPGFRFSLRTRDRWTDGRTDASSSAPRRAPARRYSTTRARPPLSDRPVGVGINCFCRRAHTTSPAPRRPSTDHRRTYRPNVFRRRKFFPEFQSNHVPTKIRVNVAFHGRRGCAVRGGTRFLRYPGIYAK